jgi:anti-anti-sigma factor
VNEPDSTIACSVEGATLISTVLIRELRDSEAVQRLKDELLAAVTLAKPRNVVVDLSQVQFVGSVGFLVFLRVRREPGVGRIVLSGMNENVRGAFLICQLISDNRDKSAPFEEAPNVRDALLKCGEAGRRA